MHPSVCQGVIKRFVMWYENDKSAKAAELLGFRRRSLLRSKGAVESRGLKLAGPAKICQPTTLKCFQFFWERHLLRSTSTPSLYENTFLCALYARVFTIFFSSPFSQSGYMHDKTFTVYRLSNRRLCEVAAWASSLYPSQYEKGAHNMSHIIQLILSMAVLWYRQQLGSFY